MSHGTLEIAFSLDRAVILSRRVVELNSDPDARRKCSLTRKTNDGLAAIGELDLSALGQLRQGHIVEYRHLMLRHCLVDECLF